MPEGLRCDRSWLRSSPRVLVLLVRAVSSAALLMLPTAATAAPPAPDQTPPTVTPLSPLDGEVVSTAAPAIRMGFADGGSGVDSATARLVLDDIDRTADCSVSGTGIAFVPPINEDGTPAETLAEGSHVVTVTVRDFAGNQGQATVQFTVDTPNTLPEITNLKPSDGSFVVTSTPEIGADLAAINPATVRLMIDGVDRTSEAEITPQHVRWLPTPSLSEAQHSVEITALGEDGTEVAASWSFTLDTRPPEISFDAPEESVLSANSVVLIRLTVFDGTSGLDEGSFSLSLDGQPVSGCSIGFGSAACTSPPLQTGEHRLVAELQDLAGNAAVEERSFTLLIDREPPLLRIGSPQSGSHFQVPSVEVMGTVSDDLGVSAVRISGQEVALEGDRFGADITLGNGLNALLVQAEDRFGRVTLLILNLTLDTEPPSLVVNTPQPDRPVNRSTVRVAGTARDDRSTPRVEVNGQAAQIDDSDHFEAVVPLVEGENSILVRAFDLAGNMAVATASVVRLTLPEVTIDSPADLTYIAETAVTVTGTVSDPAAVVGVNGVAAEIAGTTFTAIDVPLIEGGNVVTATATADNGRVGTATINLVRDTTPPRLAVRYPGDGATLFEPSVTVSGLVNDVVPGTVNASEATVFVNDRAAAVANRSFLAEAVPLALGENVLTVVAIDESGNRGEVRLTVHHKAPTVPRVALVSGGGQASVISTPLAEPLVVQLLDAQGLPVADRPVLFKVRGSNGTLGGGRRQAAVATGSDGRATAHFTLGTRAGAGGQTVEASAPGFHGPAVFTATAEPGDPALLVVDSGNHQVGIAGRALPRPFVAVVTDSGFNRLEGYPVQLAVTRGQGHFADGSTEVLVASDSDGRVVVPYVLDPEEGISNNVVEARIAGLEESPAATFVASGRGAGQAAATSITGIVLDNANQPVPGVTLRIKEHPAVTAVADAQGLFRIASAPVGTIHLIVDGSTAERSGAWPDLEFVLTTIPGRDNTVEMPIYLLPLDLQHGLLVDETRGGTVTLPEVPGFALEIAPGSVTFPGGGRSGVVSVTAVHSDKIPMVPNFGQQPRFIVTIQPAGARFDPPARLVLPNLEGLSPGEVTELYSFDHDLGHFVSIGPATVTENGKLIASNAGVGILKAGWHCGGNPSPPGTPHGCPPCQFCDGSQCVPGCLLPNAAGSAVTAASTTCSCGPDGDGDDCTGADTCQGGVCKGRPIMVTIIEPPDNPNPSSQDFATNYSFLSTTRIQARADLDPDGPPQLLLWSVTPALGGIKDEQPADRRGLDYSFLPDPPQHPTYVRGRSCSNPGNGSCDPSQPLSYRINASYCKSNDEVTITQDELDIIRQEYINHNTVPPQGAGNLPVPAREEFLVPQDSANFTASEALTTAYSVVLGDPIGLAQAVRDEFNRRIHDDIQISSVGTSGLAAGAVVVGAGSAVQRVGAILDTPPCNQAPHPATCDDRVSSNAIVAGPNGIAETVAVSGITNVGLIINSAWRNPERNEAVGGVFESRHQFGDAIDIRPVGSVAGKTDAQLWCILVTAADNVPGANGFSEQGSAQIDCELRGVSHVHVQR